MPAQQKSITRQVTFRCQVNGQISALGVQRRDFCLLRWSETDNRDWGRGEIPDLDLEGMLKISIA